MQFSLSAFVMINSQLFCRKHVADIEVLDIRRDAAATSPTAEMVM
jgi:hypothetical protein